MPRSSGSIRSASLVSNLILSCRSPSGSPPACPPRPESSRCPSDPKSARTLLSDVQPTTFVGGSTMLWSSSMLTNDVGTPAVMLRAGRSRCRRHRNADPRSRDTCVPSGDAVLPQRRCFLIDLLSVRSSCRPRTRPGTAARRDCPAARTASSLVPIGPAAAARDDDIGTSRRRRFAPASCRRARYIVT